MAKKKTTKATKRDTTKKTVAAGRKLKKKPSQKSGGKKSAKSATAKSVDSILKGFEKERVAQNSSLVSTRKKIEQITKTISSLKVELLEMQAKEGETETAIATLDDRRDKEIGSLLSNLGINLENAAAAAKRESTADLGTPLFPDDEPKKEGANENSKAKATV